uniref:Peptidase S1 domain-containing protein n=1 Tax=Bos mutus grunniens TaxID=30521 RepID=A0A8C0A8N2_BOSMU
MKGPLCLYQFWGLFFHCYGVPNSQKQWLTSLTPTIAPLSASNNIPWLVSMAETCQGIILSRWWILSTASCLSKLKQLNSDISGVFDQEDVLHGHKICLLPSFDPETGKDPVKSDVGVVLLQYPIRKKEIPLPHTYRIFWKTCYNCQYRHCRVYQYQSKPLMLSVKKSNNIKKLSVKLLDLSFCHHQHIHQTKSSNLCIWSQPEEDYIMLNNKKEKNKRFFISTAISSVQLLSRVQPQAL